ncbi:hypothetical protein Tco_1062847, partial [Tanacetum coccineum]
NPEQVRLNVLTKLQEAIEEEAILEEQILALMHRFADRFTDRRVEINNLMVLHNHLLIDYDINKAITEAEVIWAEQTNIMQWRSSIYEKNLRAVPCPSRRSLELERLLQRIESWIHRELNAILEDPNPAVLVHLVTPLFISSLEEGTSGPGGDKINYLECLHRFLSERTITFWRELRVERSNGRRLKTGLFRKRLMNYLPVEIANCLELILPVVTATVERGYWRMEFVEKELKNTKADQLFIDGLVTYIERDVFFRLTTVMAIVHLPLQRMCTTDLNEVCVSFLPFIIVIGLCVQAQILNVIGVNLLATPHISPPHPQVLPSHRYGVMEVLGNGARQWKEVTLHFFSYDLMAAVVEVEEEEEEADEVPKDVTKRLKSFFLCPTILVSVLYEFRCTAETLNRRPHHLSDSVRQRERMSRRCR